MSKAPLSEANRAVIERALGETISATRCQLGAADIETVINAVRSEERIRIRGSAPFQMVEPSEGHHPTVNSVVSADLSVDQIDEAISGLIVRGHHGAAAGVNLARVAGRALKMLQTVVGPKAALVAAESLLSNVKTGAIQ